MEIYILEDINTEPYSRVRRYKSRASKVRFYGRWYNTENGNANRSQKNRSLKMSLTRGECLFPDGVCYMAPRDSPAGVGVDYSTASQCPSVRLLHALHFLDLIQPYSSRRL